jgi:hypothetical protein
MELFCGIYVDDKKTKPEWRMSFLKGRPLKSILTTYGSGMQKDFDIFSVWMTYSSKLASWHSELACLNLFKKA